MFPLEENKRWWKEEEWQQAASRSREYKGPIKMGNDYFPPFYLFCHFPVANEEGIENRWILFCRMIPMNRGGGVENELFRAGFDAMFSPVGSAQTERVYFPVLGKRKRNS